VTAERLASRIQGANRSLLPGFDVAVQLVAGRSPRRRPDPHPRAGSVSQRPADIGGAGSSSGFRLGHLIRAFIVCPKDGERRLTAWANGTRVWC